MRKIVLIAWCWTIGISYCQATTNKPFYLYFDKNVSISYKILETKTVPKLYICWSNYWGIQKQILDGNTHHAFLYGEKYWYETNGIRNITNCLFTFKNLKSYQLQYSPNLKTNTWIHLFGYPAINYFQRLIRNNYTQSGSNDIRFKYYLTTNSIDNNYQMNVNLSKILNFNDYMNYIMREEIIPLDYILQNPWCFNGYPSLTTNVICYVDDYEIEKMNTFCITNKYATDPIHCYRANYKNYFFRVIETTNIFYLDELKNYEFDYNTATVSTNKLNISWKIN